MTFKHIGLFKVIPQVMKCFNFSISGLALDMMPWTRFLGNKAWKDLKEVVTIKRKLIGTWISRHRNVTGKTQGFIQKLLALEETEKENHDVSYEVRSIRSILPSTVTIYHRIS